MRYKIVSSPPGVPPAGLTTLKSSILAVPFLSALYCRLVHVPRTLYRLQFHGGGWGKVSLIPKLLDSPEVVQLFEVPQFCLPVARSCEKMARLNRRKTVSGW